MEMKGGCRCGAIRYEAKGDIAHHALCHCRDCQMASGAPMVAWLAVGSDNFTVTKGEPASYHGAGASVRYFCANCGTPLYFVNEDMLPDIVDINSVTLDEPDANAPGAQIQVAERREWMTRLGEMPEFERFPGG